MRDAGAEFDARAPLRICVSAGSLERTIVAIVASPSLMARITSVPPERKRAPRSDSHGGGGLANRVECS